MQRRERERERERRECVGSRERRTRIVARSNAHAPRIINAPRSCSIGREGDRLRTCTFIIFGDISFCGFPAISPGPTRFMTLHLYVRRSLSSRLIGPPRSGQLLCISFRAKDVVCAHLGLILLFNYMPWDASLKDSHNGNCDCNWDCDWDSDSSSSCS